VTGTSYSQFTINYSVLDSNVQSYTFGAWIRSTTGSSQTTLFETSNYFNLYITSTNRFKLDITDNPTITVTSTSSVAATYQWYYIVGVWNDANSLKIYINGVLEGTYNTTTNIFYIGLGVVKFGGSYSNKPYDIGDFEMYERALSDAEILSNYNTNKSTFANPTLSRQYIATTNVSSGFSKQASNLTTVITGITYTQPTISYVSNRNVTNDLGSITNGGTYPVTINRNLRVTNTTTGYTEYITGYTSSVLVNSSTVWTTGVTYNTPIALTTSNDVKSIVTSGITINAGDTVQVVWNEGNILRI
jgi:hypothetical protein